jgi:hypothetical protein
LPREAEREIRKIRVRVATQTDEPADRLLRSFSSFELLTPLLELAQDLRGFLELRKRANLLVNIGPVQLSGLTNDDPLDIDPIASARGKTLS